MRQLTVLVVFSNLQGSYRVGVPIPDLPLISSLTPTPPCSSLQLPAALLLAVIGSLQRNRPGFSLIHTTPVLLFFT